MREYPRCGAASLLFVAAGVVLLSLAGCAGGGGTSGGGTWTALASMLLERSSLAAGVINNVLYVVGSEPIQPAILAPCPPNCGGSLPPALTVVEAYDPATNAWTTLASMPTRRAGLAVGVINNILYAVADEIGSTGSTEAYDPVTNAWAALATMPTARYGLAAGVINNTLYAVGGCCAGEGSSLATVEAYDPVANAWTAKASMPTARQSLAVGVINGILYAVGGATRTATGTPVIITTPGDSLAAKTINAVTVQSTVLSTVEAYDPATNTWTTKASMPTARENLAVGVINGILYAVGGLKDQSVPIPHGTSALLTAVEAYNPVRNTWTTKAPMPTAHRGSLAAGVINNVLYVVETSNTAGVPPSLMAFTP